MSHFTNRVIVAVERFHPGVAPRSLNLAELTQSELDLWFRRDHTDRGGLWDVEYIDGTIHQLYGDEIEVAA